MVHTDTAFHFLVPPGARARLLSEFGRGKSGNERSTSTTLYLDTPGRHLARNGLSWRLRHEGQRWIQGIESRDGALTWSVHEVIRPDASHDATEHAGTAQGERLLKLLSRLQRDGVSVDVRFRTELQRTVRRVRTRGATVDVVYEEGRLVSPQATVRVRSLAFEHRQGDAGAMLALAERWRRRFGLFLDPRRLSERGDRLSEGHAHLPPRKAMRATYAADASPAEAFRAVLDECLAQVLHNAIGLVDGDSAQREAHVHQLRVGIRRLRSALRCFEGWVPEAPADGVAGLRRLFADLGAARDADVLDAGVALALAEAGAPALRPEDAKAGQDPAAALRAEAVQRLFLDWLGWRVGLDVASPAPASSPTVADPAGPDAPPANDEAPVAAVAEPGQPPAPDVSALDRRAAERIARWHRRIAAEARRFETLEIDAIHDLRKRVKRQRYAVEFFAPLLRRKGLVRYLEPLAEVQERLGELNDLFVARAHYEQALPRHPQAWFALGWLAARIAELRTGMLPSLRRLARSEPPGD